MFTDANQAFAESIQGRATDEIDCTSGLSNGTIRLTLAETYRSFYYGFAKLLYTEAFARLGYKFELFIFPPKRALIESNSGRMDGDAGRILFSPALKADYSNLVLVNESVAVINIAAYTADTSIHLKEWKELAGRKLRMGYPRGTLAVEKQLSIMDKDYIFEVTDVRQGLRMLIFDRIDLFVWNKLNVDKVLNEEEFIN